MFPHTPGAGGRPGCRAAAARSGRACPGGGGLPPSRPASASCSVPSAHRRDLGEARTRGPHPTDAETEAAGGGGGPGLVTRTPSLGPVCARGGLCPPTGAHFCPLLSCPGDRSAPLCAHRPSRPPGSRGATPACAGRSPTSQTAHGPQARRAGPTLTGPSGGSVSWALAACAVRCLDHVWRATARSPSGPCPHRPHSARAPQTGGQTN